MATINRQIPHKHKATESSIDKDIDRNFNMDRGFEDVLTLPYTYDEAKVKPNEFATSDNINTCLHKLHYNFLYLNSRCKMASSLIPTRLDSVLVSQEHPIVPLSADVVISNHSTTDFLINGQIDPTLTLVRGGTYTLKNVTAGYNFRISETSDGTKYRGADVSADTSMVFNVPYNSPDTLFYFSPEHPSTMFGKIQISDYRPGWLKPSNVCIDPTKQSPSDVFANIVKYEQCPDLNIPDLIVPTNVLSGAENLSWSTTYRSEYFCEDNYLSMVRQFSVIDTIYVHGDYYLIIGATKDHLLAMEAKFDNRVNAVREYSNKVESVNDIVFEDISSLVINPNNIMYVADQQTNMVYQYSIEHLTTNNPVMRDRGKILVKSIGGKGTDRARERFNSPIKIAIGNNNDVFVLDYKEGKNSSVKVYDENLNWKRTMTKRAEWANHKPVDLLVDRRNNNFYVLMESGFLFCCDRTGKLTNKFNLLLDYTGSDKPKKYKQVVFSRDDMDIIYILNDKGVVKKWLTKLDSKIGFFNLARFGVTDINIQSLGLYSGSLSINDSIFALGKSTISPTCGKLLRLYDTNDYVSLIYDDYKNYTYSYEQIKIKPEEFITHIVLNKSFLKMQYNHSIFKDNIHSTFSGLYDSLGESEYTGLRYLIGDRADIYNFEWDASDLVGINEIVLSEVINRLIKNIHDFQNSLLASLQSEYLNFYPITTAPIHLR